jgi:hypothetical protein
LTNISLMVPLLHSLRRYRILKKRIPTARACKHLRKTGKTPPFTLVPFIRCARVTHTCLEPSLNV